MVNARSPERPLILLSCPPGELHLCQALHQALARAAPGPSLVQIVKQGDATPSRPGDLGIALYLDSRMTNGLEGHLEWQIGLDGTRQTGPKVRVDVMDAPLSPRMYGQFADGLIRADTALRDALARQPDI